MTYASFPKINLKHVRNKSWLICINIFMEMPYTKSSVTLFFISHIMQVVKAVATWRTIYVPFTQLTCLLYISAGVRHRFIVWLLLSAE